ncbi:MAG: hypothetical protein GY757_35305 [bacterium]|nr:hypothetical protein [bacterium]
MFHNSLRKLILLLIAVFVMTGLSLLAGTTKRESAIRIKRGATQTTMQGVTRRWRDVRKLGPGELALIRRPRPIMNFDRNLPLINRNDTDPVVQPAAPKTAELQREALTPTTLSSFNGMNFDSNGAGWPPDTTGDVGTTYYVQAVNTSIGIYRKSDGSLVSATTFDSFFGGTGISGTPCDSNNNGDPLVLYDRYSNRWFILDFAWYSSYSGGSYYSIAVSKTGDPTGDWWQYAFQADNVLMNDYPKAGIWHDGIYITANMFNFSSGSYQHVKVWALRKPDIYNGTLISQTVTDSHTRAYSLLPSNAKSATAPPSSAPNYMYCLDANEWGSGHSDALCVWKYDVDWNNAGNTTWTGPTVLGTAAFSLTASQVPQKDTSTTLDTLYGRLMYPSFYRNFGSYESVYLCHVADTSSRRAMRWYEVRINNGTSSIYQQSTYSPDSNHRWMGSIGADRFGNMLMGYSESSSNMFPAISYAGRMASDPLNTLTEGENTMVSGGGSQTLYNRWGDYSTMSIDPVDDETFWYTQEYYSSSGTNWNTRIGSIRMPSAFPPAPPVSEDLVPTMTSNTSSGTAAASSVYSSTSYAAWKAFDGEDAGASWSRWISEYVNNFTTAQWISYQFTYAKFIDGYYILPEYGSTTKNRSPKNWQFQGWNGSLWVTLDSRSNIRNDIEWSSNGLYFEVANPGVYSKYRLYVTAVNGSDVVSIRQFKMYSIGVVPFMTSNSSPSGSVSTSSTYSASYTGWKAFDGTDQSGSWSRWISEYVNNFTTPQWIYYSFQGLFTKKKVRHYYILPEYASSTKNRSPKTWELQGYKGFSWHTLDTRSNILNDSQWNAGGLHFTVQNPGSYYRYRLYVTAVNGSDVVSIRQLKLFTK